MERAITVYFWLGTVLFIVAFLAGNSGLGKAARQGEVLLGLAFLATIVLGFLWLLRSELWAELTKERKNSVLFGFGVAFAVALLFEIVRR